MKYSFGNIAICIVVCQFFTTNNFAQINRDSDFNPNGWNVILHTNGKVASEGMMRNGKPDGYWKSFYPSGIMSSEGNRVNYLRDSIWVFFTQTGDTSQIINYRLDKRSGFLYQFETVTERNRVSKHYLKSKELYLDDKKEGPSYYYYPSGKIRQIIGYKNGKKQGVSKEFDENGMVITLYEYHDDYMTSREYINRVNAKGEKVGTWKTFYPDGNLKEEEFYKNGVLDGTSRIFSERGTGILINEIVYREGKIIEEGIQMKTEPMLLTTYYDDGITPKRKGTYLDSIPIGDHYFYNSDGKPEMSFRYSSRGTGIRIHEGPVDANERRTGDWKFFAETGELRASGKYVNDRQYGEWKFYYMDGKIQQTGNFNNGMEGEWKWYYPSGNILREEIYERGQPNGKSVQYSDSATIVAQGEYVDGEREGFWIEHVGDIREEGNYQMGNKHGVWKAYQTDGQLYHTGNFVEGNPDGKHLFYYPDGTLKEEQYYVMGRRDKNWKKYYENGALFLTITYNNDLETRINGARIK